LRDEFSRVRAGEFDISSDCVQRGLADRLCKSLEHTLIFVPTRFNSAAWTNSGNAPASTFFWFFPRLDTSYLFFILFSSSSKMLNTSDSLETSLRLKVCERHFFYFRRIPFFLPVRLFLTERRAGTL
jgi:hypothetical protein